jgi:hypothetical protein
MRKFFIVIIGLVLSSFASSLLRNIEPANGKPLFVELENKEATKWRDDWDHHDWDYNDWNHREWHPHHRWPHHREW